MALTGLPDSSPIPRFAREFRPASGVGLSTGSLRPVVLMGQKSTSGVEAVDSLGAFVADDADAAVRFGRRSELMWMLRAYRAVDPTGPVRMVAAPPPAGGTPATVDILFSNDSNSACTVYVDTCAVNIPGKARSSVGISDGDGPVAVATAVAAILNGDPDLPFAATLGATSYDYGYTKSSSGSFPLALVAGDTFIGKVDQQGSATTWTVAVTAAVLTGSGATYAAVTAGHTLVLNYGGTNATVTFTGSEANQAAFHNAINGQVAISGATKLGLVSNSAGESRFTTNQKGTGAAGAIVSGDADVLASLGITAAAFTNAGPNDAIADAAATTAAEFAALLTAKFTGGTAGSTGIANADNSVSWWTNTPGASPKGVQWTGGTGQAKVSGWDLLEHNGTAAASKVLTLTTFQVGTRSKQWLNKVRVTLDDPSNTMTVAVGSITGGSGAEDLTGAIAAIDAAEHGYIVPAATATAAVSAGDGQLGAVANYLASSIMPSRGKSQQMVCAVSGTASQAVAVQQSINSPYAKVVPAQGNDWPPCMWAAHWAAILRSRQVVYAAWNGRDYSNNVTRGEVCLFPAPHDSGDIYTDTEVTSILNGGGCVVTWAGGVAKIIRDITSYSWIGSAATADYRAREGHIVSVLFKFWEDLFGILLTTRQPNVANDPKKGNKPVPKTTTPASVKSSARSLIVQMCGTYQDGGPLLDPSALDEMLAAVDCTMGTAGWRLTVALKAVRHDLFDDVLIAETGNPY